MRRTAIFFLLTTLALSSCKSVRTVYDENGKVVKESEGANFTDIHSHMEKQWGDSFSEKKNAEGVPEATSSKVSSFQKELDAARRNDKEFLTGDWNGRKDAGLRGMVYDADGRAFGEGKRYETFSSSAYTTSMTPDFLKSGRGLTPSEEQGALGGQTSGLAGRYNDARSMTYEPGGAAPYSRETESGYFESRRHNAKEPVIVNYRDYYQRGVQDIRGILGRDPGSTTTD